MPNLFYFIAGMLIIEFLPLLEKIIELAMTYFEYQKGVLGVKITEANAEIDKLSEKEEEAPARLIGFSIPDESEDDLDEEQD